MCAFSVYELSPDLDDPRRVGLASNGPSVRGNFSVIEDFNLQGCSVDSQAFRLAEIWRPLNTIGKINAGNDFPCLSLLISAFSRRAVDVLREFLEPNGELLPLKSAHGEFYAYNVTTVVDALDRERSEVDWLSDDPGPWDARAIRIIHYEFIYEKVKDLTVFRIPEWAGNDLVTSEFVKRVQTSELGGFSFKRVWSAD